MPPNVRASAAAEARGKRSDCMRVLGAAGRDVSIAHWEAVKLWPERTQLSHYLLSGPIYNVSSILYFLYNTIRHVIMIASTSRNQ
jgi:hypothetical protein